MSLPGGCLVVRTYFGDQEAWERLMAAVQQPDSDDGYVATVTFVDDPSSTAMSADELRAQVADNPESPMVSFIADERAQRAKGSPLLAVWVAPPDPELDTSDYAPFRVIASELSTVEVNINLGNLDWDNFAGAVDADGVYRGSNNEDHNASTEWWQRGTYEFQTIVDRLLDPARRPARASLLTDVVLADVVIEASKQTALRRWRDIDSAWIADGVNPTGPSPHTYRLHHRSPLIEQDITLTMLMQYLAHGADQVPFRVTYLRYTRSPARRWEEPLDNPRSLLVTVSDVDDEHSRCTIQQDACPSTLIEPLSQLWDALARRLQG